MQVAERLPVVSMRCGKPKLRKMAAPADSKADGAAPEDSVAVEQLLLHVTLSRQAGAATSGRSGAAAAGSRARVYAPRHAPSLL